VRFATQRSPRRSGTDLARGQLATGYIAWRILMHEKGRNALAVGGIFIAVLMIFLQLGFYFSVPKGGMRVYDRLRFDLLLTSSAYDFQGRSYDFPRCRKWNRQCLFISPQHRG
jgi:hypothetical protein